MQWWSLGDLSYLVTLLAFAKGFLYAIVNSWPPDVTACHGLYAGHSRVRLIKYSWDWWSQGSWYDGSQTHMRQPCSTARSCLHVRHCFNWGSGQKWVGQPSRGRDSALAREGVLEVSLAISEADTEHLAYLLTGHVEYLLFDIWICLVLEE